MAKPGPKSKYTPETVKKILNAIAVGAPYVHACGYAGISQDTFERWRAKHAEFAEAIKNAEGKAVVGWLDKIEKAAAEGNWQAVAWKLERRYHEHFGRRDKQRVEIVKPTEAAREAFQSILSETGISEERAREIVMARFPDVSEQELIVTSESVM